MEFCVGDRVAVFPSVYEATKSSSLSPKSNMIEGDIGTVVVAGNSVKCVGICFDRYIGGHSLSGRCKEGHGWTLTVIDGGVVLLDALIDKSCEIFDEDSYKRFLFKGED